MGWVRGDNTEGGGTKLRGPEQQMQLLFNQATYNE
jgi:hypothetical protein